MCRERIGSDHLTSSTHLAVIEAKRALRIAARTSSFWPQVDRGGPVPEFAAHLGPCWLWLGKAVAIGTTCVAVYGRSQRIRGEQYAHRVSYALTRGPIPVGLQIDHLCRVTLCVNPEHLEAVTCKENIRRGKNGVLRHLRAKPARSVQTHCPHGHERTAENLYPSGNCRPCNRAAVQRYHARKRRVAA